MIAKQQSAAVAFALGNLLFSPSIVHADDWGCQVLLCLSDPRGPTTEPACRPPIERLWRHLARRGSFPTCGLAGTSSDTYAKVVNEVYDPCPPGTIPAPTGNVVTQAAPASPGQPAHVLIGSQWFAISGPVGYSELPPNEDGGGQGPRACIGKRLGAYALPRASDEDPLPVTVYDRVAWMPAKPPMAIDVIVNGSLSRRVRW